MNRNLLLWPLLLLLFIAKSNVLSAETPAVPVVNEEKSNFEMVNGTARLQLSVTNPGAKTLKTHIALSFLTPSDVVVKALERDEVLKPGNNELHFQLAQFLNGLKEGDKAQLPWFRLRYRLEIQPGETIHSIASLSRLMPKTFQLQLGLASDPRPGEPLVVHVFAKTPVGIKPVEGIQLDAELTISPNDDSKDQVVTMSGRTDAQGISTFRFPIPGIIPDSDITVRVKGKHGNEVHTVKNDAYIRPYRETRVTTDKPIYQPGQSLKIRTLAFNEQGKALQGEHLQLEIRDLNYSIVYQTDLATSRFGEAHAEWTIPENARLGQYYIISDNGHARLSFEVRRYDLPNFSVSVKSDRPYYVGQENAVVEIQADYLFGQPVAHAKVRIVEHSPSDSASAVSLIEGEADIHGHFTAKIDLRKRFQQLVGEYQPFDDAVFTAYATDPTTGRTEMRQFALRVSREAIHVHVGTPHTMTAKLPFSIYIAAQYPDGSPAECDVEVIPTSSNGKPILSAARTVHTNRFGIALFQEDSLPTARMDDFESLDLILKAKDGAGGTGTNKKSIYFEDDATWGSTDKIRYASGESISFHIRSSHDSGPVVVDVFRDRFLLSSQIVQLAGGTGDITIPTNEKVWGQIQIAAQFAGESANYSDGDSRSVIFPNNRGLEVELQPGRDLYAPGDDAVLSFRVRSRQKNPVESLLGISVVDRAVEERYRADYSQYPESSGSGMDYASVTKLELGRADRTIAIPEDLRLAAEYLLNSRRGSRGPREFSQSTDGSPADAFGARINSMVSPLKSALDARFKKDRAYPTDEASFESLLAEAGLNSNDFRDPWDGRFQFLFETDHEQSMAKGLSAGPDKVMGTGDDFTALEWGWPYFQLRGDTLKQAVSRYQDSSREFVRDVPSLRKALQQVGEDLDKWLDPWGRAYRYEFGVSGTLFSITVTSAGKDGIFSSKDKFSSDDASVLYAFSDYTNGVRRRLQQVVDRFYRETGSFPETETQVQQAIREDDVPTSELTDPWGHRYYVSTGKVFEYRDNIVRDLLGEELTYAEYLKLQTSVSGILPVTAEVRMITFRSVGPDGIESTTDDFDLFRLSRIMAEQAATNPTAKPVANSPISANGEGSIAGVVKDDTEALIPGATIHVQEFGVEVLQTITNNMGAYTILHLKPGYYDVRFEIAGFQQYVIRDVPVQERAIQLDVVLNVSRTFLALADSNFSRSSGAALLQEDAEVGSSFGSSSEKAAKLKAGSVPSAAIPPISSTPRLRQFFPETLVWQPALETDRKGNAELRFKLADNITQWSVSAIASTTDGQIGTATASITSWRPFFVEHDPPKSLTVGDEIALPVVMRSYLDRDQALTVDIKPESWFSVTGTTQRKTSIKAGEATREIFGIKALAPIKDGKQRITAAGTELSDAIEKPVSVHPDGREVVQSQSRILQGASVFELNVPANALNNTVHAELKLYPDLLSQLTDAMENILRRPYGCAEQQISSAYPGLLLLRHQREFGGVSSAVLDRSRRNLAEAYASLLGYRTESGGFSYWGSGTPDIAVTAYAVEFLHSAKQFIAVDENVLRNAAVWLAGKQLEDGSWTRSDASTAARDRADTVTLTGYVLRVVSNPEIGKLLMPLPDIGSKKTRDTVGEAMQFVRLNAEQWGEPSALASVALAALNTGDRETAMRTIARLEQLSHREGDAAYWDLQTNTVFFGWGLPGRVESTALSVRALAGGAAIGIRSEKTQVLIDQGLQYLLRNKDRYGVWYSTQSTIRVLETIERFIGKPAKGTSGKGRVEVWVNGSRLDSFFDLSSSKNGGPIALDVSRYVRAGNNRIELRGPGSTMATVQLVESHYVPWEGDVSAAEPALRLGVRFDRTEGKSGDDITATVKVERVGFRGYGMMLAEIGLPPGVDVDRASLDRAVAAAGTTLYRYDVLPDRIIAYVWPKAGGSEFQFKFRTRYGMNAQTPASSLYDYYNPEAQTVLRPVRFRMD